MVEKEFVGINVVRGGYFQEFDIKIGLNYEMDVLYNYSLLLKEKGIKYKFFTTGSLLDNNTLKYFMEKYNISDDLIVIPNNTKELIQKINNFSSCVTIRNEISCICASLDIPFIQLKLRINDNKIFNKIIDWDNWNQNNLIKYLYMKDDKNITYMEDINISIIDIVGKLGIKLRDKYNKKNRI